MQEFIDRIFNEYKVTDYDALMKLQDNYIDKENELIIKLDSIENNNKFLNENKFDILFDFCVSMSKDIEKLNRIDIKNEVEGLDRVISRFEGSLSFANIFIGYSSSFQKLLADVKRYETRLNNINKRLLDSDLEYSKAKSLFLERSRVISSLNKSKHALELSKENIGLYVSYLNVENIYNSFSESISSFKEFIDKVKDKKVKKSLNNIYLNMNKALKEGLIEVASRESENRLFMKEAGISIKDSEDILIKEEPVIEEIKEEVKEQELEEAIVEEKDKSFENIINNQKKLEDGINDIIEKKSRFFTGSFNSDDNELVEDEISNLAKEVDTKNIDNEVVEINETSIIDDPIEQAITESKEEPTHDEKVNHESDELIDQVAQESEFSHESFINSSLMDRVVDESKEESQEEAEKVEEPKIEEVKDKEYKQEETETNNSIKDKDFDSINETKQLKKSASQRYAESNIFESPTLKFDYLPERTFPPKNPRAINSFVDEQGTGVFIKSEEKANRAAGNKSYFDVSYDEVVKISNDENHGRLDTPLKVEAKEIIDLDEFTTLKKKVKLLLSKKTLNDVKHVLSSGLLTVSNSRLLTENEFLMKKLKAKENLEKLSNVLERK